MIMLFWRDYSTSSDINLNNETIKTRTYHFSKPIQYIIHYDEENSKSHSISQSIVEETHSILTMYRVINPLIESLTKDRLN